MDRITPQTATIWLNKLLTHRAEELTSPEVSAQHTLKICCAILDPVDPPSPGGYPPRIISAPLAAWLMTLSEFNSVARLERYHKVIDGPGVVVMRLWLLPDWLDSEEQRRARAAYQAQQSREWVELRLRFWRVYQKLLANGATKKAAREMTESFWNGYRMKFAAQAPLLRMLGFDEEITAEQYDQFEREFRLKPGHTYVSPVDFTQENTTEETETGENDPH